MLSGDLAVLQAPMLDGLSFDPFALFDYAFGTPEEVLETLLRTQEATGFGELICQMSYGMMPLEWVKESMALFSEEVLPTLKARETPSTHSTPYAEVEEARGASSPTAATA